MKFSGLDVVEDPVSMDDADARRELLLLAPSIRVPCLSHGDVRVWDSLAIAEYLNEIRPESRLFPETIEERAHCRSVCGEMHSGFASMRSALPFNVKARFPNHKIWNRAQADIDRVTEIWRDCIGTFGGPYLFGGHRTVAEAMYAPVVLRFLTYDVALDDVCKAYCEQVLAMPEVSEWVEAARGETEEIDELDMEF